MKLWERDLPVVSWISLKRGRPAEDALISLFSDKIHSPFFHSLFSLGGPIRFFPAAGENLYKFSVCESLCKHPLCADEHNVLISNDL